MTFTLPRVSLYWCVIVPFVGYMFCFHERAYAQAPPQKDCVSAHSLVFSAPSPCTGILIPEVDAVIALRCVTEKLPECEASRAADKLKFEARVASWKKTWEAERTRADRLSVLLDNATKVAPPESPWWKHPVLWTVVGITLGAASTYAIVKLSEK